MNFISLIYFLADVEFSEDTTRKSLVAFSSDNEGDDQIYGMRSSLYSSAANAGEQVFDDKEFMRKITTIDDMNWAWELKIGDKWVQFNCLNCMMVEINYKAYSHIKKVEVKKNYETVELDIGLIDFPLMSI